MMPAESENELEGEQIRQRDLGEQEKGVGTSKLCYGDLRVILNYMIAEQERKRSGLRIGIFSVFLVVAVITMLKAVVSVTPIIFVKIG